MRHGRTPEIPRWDTKIYEKAAQRVTRLETYALLDWADAAGSGMARGFSDHRKDGNLESLEEIESALITLWALVQDLRERAIVTQS